MSYKLCRKSQLLFYEGKCHLSNLLKPFEGVNVQVNKKDLGGIQRSLTMSLPGGS